MTTASILFPNGAVFFGFVATFLMVVGGFGLAAGIQTPICAVMIIVFLITDFGLHWHWLKVLPTMVPVVKAAIKDDKAQGYFRSFDRQSYHAHEVGLRDNLVFLVAAVLLRHQRQRSLWYRQLVGRLGGAVFLSSLALDVQSCH